DIDHLTWLITWIGGICLLLAEGVLFYSAVRFRRRGARPARYSTGEVWSQARWVLIPVMVVVALDLLIDVANASAWHEIKGSIPRSHCRVRIVGQQFAWHFTLAGRDEEFDTDDDVRTVGELHVPAYTDVNFELQARDVLHSFWVPSLRLKQDAVPGRTIPGWFRALETGSYDIACAEICGAGHSLMSARLVVHDPDEYGRWIRERSSGTKAPLTVQQLMTDRGCFACHSTDGSRLVGPTYQDLFGRETRVFTDGRERTLQVDEEYLRRSILDPQADIVQGYPPTMPAQQNLSEAELALILEYLKSCR
ncbi:MAG: cytochrome c oxidase subunit II, partial [Candidatus Eremiobacterota bacterium]